MRGRAAEVAERLHAAERYTDISDMLGRTRAQFVLALTPLLTHAPIKTFV